MHPQAGRPFHTNTKLKTIINFIRHCLSRVNPVLAPRRKRETAERHLRAVRLVNRWLAGMMPSQGDAVRQWAAGVILDASSASRNTCPPGFGSADWNDKDGVLKYTLKLAADTRPRRPELSLRFKNWLGAWTCPSCT